MRVVRAVPFAGLIVAAACTITQEVEPVPPGVTRAVCIKENTETWSEEFLPELRKQFEARGMATSVYGNTPPADCAHYVEYDAEWTWDMAIYLELCDIRVYQADGEMIGRAEYDARGGGANMGKFGSTSDKLSGMMDQLVGGVSAAPQPTPAD